MADELGQTVTLPYPDGGDVLFFCDTVAEDGRYLVVCEPGDWASQFWVDLSSGTVTLIAAGDPQTPTVTDPEQALERLAEYQYSHDLSCLYRETAADAPLSVRFFWDRQYQDMELTITQDGEDKDCFYFICLWADSPESAYRYSVQRADGQVAFLGEPLTADGALALLLERYPQPGPGNTGISSRDGSPPSGHGMMVSTAGSNMRAPGSMTAGSITGSTSMRPPGRELPGSSAPPKATPSPPRAEGSPSPEIDLPVTGPAQGSSLCGAFCLYKCGRFLRYSRKSSSRTVSMILSRAAVRVSFSSGKVP